MKILISLIKSKNLTYINFLYNKYVNLLVNLGYYIIKNNYPHLPIERDDLHSTAFEACNNLWKVSEETIERYGVERILKMQMVQRVIMICRKYNTHSNKILNNYVQIPDDIFNDSSYVQFDVNAHEINLIMERNKDKIDKLDDVAQLIFRDYYMNNLTRREIAKNYNLPIQLVNKKVDYLKRLINNKFVK